MVALCSLGRWLTEFVHFTTHVFCTDSYYHYKQYQYHIHYSMYFGSPTHEICTVCDPHLLDGIRLPLQTLSIPHAIAILYINWVVDWRNLSCLRPISSLWNQTTTTSTINTTYTSYQLMVALCSLGRWLTKFVLELTLQSLSPVLALYDPFGVDVPLNCDTTTTTTTSTGYQLPCSGCLGSFLCSIAQQSYIIVARSSIRRAKMKLIIALCEFSISLRTGVVVSNQEGMRTKISQYQNEGLTQDDNRRLKDSTSEYPSIYTNWQNYFPNRGHKCPQSI